MSHIPRYYLILLAFLSLSIEMICQVHVLDSIDLVLKNSKEDTLKVNTLAQKRIFIIITGFIMMRSKAILPL